MNLGINWINFFRYQFWMELLRQDILVSKIEKFEFLNFLCVFFCISGYSMNLGINWINFFRYQFRVELLRQRYSGF